MAGRSPTWTLSGRPMRASWERSATGSSSSRAGAACCTFTSSSRPTRRALPRPWIMTRMTTRSSPTTMMVREISTMTASVASRKCLVRPGRVLFPLAVSLGVLVTASLPGPLLASPPPATPGYGSLVEEGQASVVAVRFQLRPKERPKGGEGEKAHHVLFVVFAPPHGQIITSGGIFADHDDVPDAYE